MYPKQCSDFVSICNCTQNVTQATENNKWNSRHHYLVQRPFYGGPEPEEPHPLRSSERNTIRPSFHPSSSSAPKLPPQKTCTHTKQSENSTEKPAMGVFYRFRCLLQNSVVRLKRIPFEMNTNESRITDSISSRRQKRAMLPRLPGLLFSLFYFFFCCRCCCVSSGATFAHCFSSAAFPFLG